MKSRVLPALLLLLCSIAALAQSPAECRAPALVSLPAGASMFSPAQEIELGEILRGTMEQHLHVIDDPALTSYLYRIGARVEKNFPDSALKFQYHIIDIAEANAFSQP